MHRYLPSLMRQGFTLAALLATACFANPSPAPLPASSRAGIDHSATRLLGKAYPGTQNSLTQSDSVWVEKTLNSLTLREKIGQLIIPWVSGEYAAVGSPEFEQIRKWVDEDRVGGLIMSIGLPHSYAAKLNEMQRRAALPLLIVSDMENGTGMRLANIYAFPSLLAQGGGTVFPPVMSLGAIGSTELAFALGRVLGTEARAVGVHVTTGPVLDVNSNPLNPVINTRSFGENPMAVSALGAAYIRGARSAGLLTVAKHFPGHGDAGTNSHIALPVIDRDRAYLDKVDLPPFRAAIDAGVDGMMTGHIAVTGVDGPDAPPATLSPRFMTQILRTELGFKGLLLTDAMTMAGVAKKYGPAEPLVLALNAGANVLLMPRGVPEAIQTITDAAQSGRVSRERIDDAVRRILTAKARAGLIQGRLVSLEAIDSIVNIPAHAAVAREIAERSITLVRDSSAIVPIRKSDRKILSITYSEASDVIAGRVFKQELTNAGKVLRSVNVDARTTIPEWAALRSAADSFDVVLVSAYVVPSDDADRVQVEGGISAFAESVAVGKRKIIIISFGSPYLLNAFPSIPAYMLAWGGAPLSQRAAAQAILGNTDISGHLPVSLPPLHRLGDGLSRFKTNQ